MVSKGKKEQECEGQCSKIRVKVNQGGCRRNEKEDRGWMSVLYGHNGKKDLEQEVFFFSPD